MKLPPRYVGVGAVPNVVVDAALAIVTSCVADAARKFAVAAPLAWTLHVPAPLELNVAPLTSAHGPLTKIGRASCRERVYVFAVAVTFKTKYVGVGATPIVL